MFACQVEGQPPETYPTEAEALKRADQHKRAGKNHVTIRELP